MRRCCREPSKKFDQLITPVAWEAACAGLADIFTTYQARCECACTGMRAVFLHWREGNPFIDPDNLCAHFFTFACEVITCQHVVDLLDVTVD